MGDEDHSNGSSAKKIFGMRVVETLVGAAVIGSITYLITIPQINTKIEMQIGQLCTAVAKLEKTSEEMVKTIYVMQLKDAVTDHDVMVLKDNIKKLEREKKMREP